jgi:4-oxalomesaconate tautomerase
MENTIRCMWMRGGTSKGVYFLASDLPTDIAERDAVILHVMGTPDKRQIDGLGGADSLTSKAAIVSKSTSDDADIDFLFAQVGIDKPLVDTKPNCGNLLAGVGPFAVERGLFPADPSETRVRIRIINTGTLVEEVIQTPGGVVKYEGSETIDGVPGTAAPIAIHFMDASGSVCGSLLPTGSESDTICGVRVTCIDNGMPVVVLAATNLDCTGYESCTELEGNERLRQKLEQIRLEAGPKMGLGDVTFAVIPKMVHVAAPKAGGVISTRSFLPHKCHDAIGVFGAVSVATACILPRSSAYPLANLPDGKSKRMRMEHPTGLFEVVMDVGGTKEKPTVDRVGVVRTARVLLDGMARLPVDLAKLLPINRR